MNFLKNIFQSEEPKSNIIFLVEDDPAYSKMTNFYLKAHFPSMKEVKILSVGEAALDALDMNPDVIIIDYFLNSQIPDAKTGLDIIKQIRQRKPNMNIIVLSGQSDVQVAIDAITKYHCSYVRKDDEAFERIGDILEELGH